MASGMSDALFSAMDAELARRLRQYAGNPSHLDTLSTMLDAEPAERPIALVGAGLSAPLPGWQALLGTLGDVAIGRGTATSETIQSIKELGANDPLAAASRLFESLGGKELALPELRRLYQLPGNRPTACHRLVMRLPFKGFVTTNYDSGLGHAWRDEHGEIGTELDVATHADGDAVRQWLDGSIFGASTTPIMHLHGAVDRPATMVLDEASYHEVYEGPGSAPFRRFFEDLWLKQRLVLLGFSGNDPIIRLIAARTLKELKWAGAPPQHLAILPLEPDRTHEAEGIRRSFYHDFHAHVYSSIPPRRPARHRSRIFRRCCARWCAAIRGRPKSSAANGCRRTTGKRYARGCGARCSRKFLAPMPPPRRAPPRSCSGCPPFSPSGQRSSRWQTRWR